MRLADLVRRVLGPDVPIGVRAYDGSESTPPGAVATLILLGFFAVTMALRPGWNVYESRLFRRLVW